MAKHGTAPSLSNGQFAEFAAAIIRQLPRDLEPEAAQGWIENQAALAKVLREALVPPDGISRGFKQHRCSTTWHVPGGFVRRFNGSREDQATKVLA